MTVSECMDQVASIKGVRAAAVVSEEGYIVDGRANDGVELEALGGWIGSTLGASRALGQLLGEGELQQATIEYRDGPVLVVPLRGPGAGNAVVVVLSSIDPLGRVRFGLRRLLPEIDTAVAAHA